MLRQILSKLYFLYSVFSVVIITSLLIFFIFPLHFFSKRLFRRIVDFFIATWLKINSALIILFGTKYYVYSTESDLNRPSFIIMNHKNELDWFQFFVISSYFQDPRYLKIAMKNSVKHVPGLGWACQLGCYLFLDRNWEKDQLYLDRFIQYYSTLNYPIQLLFFCEGTNLCKKSQELSDRFALKNGYPCYSHVLHPRVRGFTKIIELIKKSNLIHLDNFCIYDVTIAYKNDVYEYSDIFWGKWTKEVHVHFQNINICSLPIDEEERAEWLRKRWEMKEKSLENFYKTGRFIEDPPLITSPLARNIKFSFLVYNLILLPSVYIIYLSKSFKVFIIISFLFSIYFTKYWGFDKVILGIPNI